MNHINTIENLKEQDLLPKFERHARLVFEHKPKELRVAVNGNFQGMLKVNSDLNEIDLAVPNKEQVEFIEVYNEQQMRLLFLNIENSPPHPTANSTHTLNLSDERKLQVNFGFVPQGVEIKLRYFDPTYKEVQSLLENPQLLKGESFPIVPTEQNTSTAPSIGNWFATFVSNITHLFSFRWRRLALASLVAIIAFGGYVLVERQSKLSANAILEEAEIKKLNWRYQPDKILHWVEEETFQNSPRLTSGRRISHRWSNNRGGQREDLILKYDEQNQLFWGRWIKADGTEIVFRKNNNNEIKIYPGIPLIKQKLASLSEEDAKVMQKYLADAEMGVDSEKMSQKNARWMISNYSDKLVRTHEIDDNKKVLCVVLKSNPEIASPENERSEIEIDFDENTLRQIYYRSTVFLNDGRLATEESRLLSSNEATIEEFENNDLARMMVSGKNIKHISVEEFAKFLRPFYPPNKN